MLRCTNRWQVSGREPAHGAPEPRVRMMEPVNGEARMVAMSQFFLVLSASLGALLLLSRGLVRPVRVRRRR